MRKKILHLCCGSIFLLAGYSLFAQPPVFSSITPNATSINRFEKFELNIKINAQFTNPFDYNDISVRCVFSNPNGRKDTVDGFYYEDFVMDTVAGKLKSTATDMFKVRFTPRQKGTWKYQLICATQHGTTVSEEKTFTCLSHDDKGFIRANETNYLGFDDGSQFIPVGENINVYQMNIYKDFHSWVDKLADNGANFIRPWLINYGFGLEWKNGVDGYKGLMRYNEENSFWLDWLVDYCGEKRVYIMLCLSNATDYDKKDFPFWDVISCTHINNNKCNYAWEYYTNPRAREYLKNRLRYIVARWGYSTNIACWELMNEPDGDPQYDKYKNDVTNWTKDIASFVRRIDPYNHLISASYSYFENGEDTWRLHNIDFTQPHMYFTQPNLERSIAAVGDQYIKKFNKPTLCGEFGIYSSDEPLYKIDPNGVYFHNTIWATAFSGAMGPALTYWWYVYIDKQNLYYHFKSLSAFLNHLNLKEENYEKTEANITGGEADTVSVKPGAGWKIHADTSFTVDGSGKVFLQLKHLDAYLYGKEINTETRNPPVFHVNYSKNGQFIVTTGATKANAPQIAITVDGQTVLSQPAQVNSNYSIKISAGPHTIKVDNTGKDWVLIDKYVFADASPLLNTYVLQSASKSKAAGYILNSRYNWQYLQAHDGALPPEEKNCSLIIPGMETGNYTIRFFSCTSGEKLSEINKATSSNILSIPLPPIRWDLSFTATRTN